MTSSIVAAVEADHISTEDQVPRPKGWDPLHYPQYDHIFQRLGYRVRRITTRIPYFIRRRLKTSPPPTRTPKPTETIIVKGKDCKLITDSELRREKAWIEDEKQIAGLRYSQNLPSSEFPDEFHLQSLIRSLEKPKTKKP